MKQEIKKTRRFNYCLMCEAS